MKSTSKSRWERVLGSAFAIALAATIACDENASGKEKDSTWFQPFSWQEPQEETSLSSPPPIAFKGKWNPLTWSNEPRPTEDAASKTESRALPSEPAMPYVQVQDSTRGTSSNLLQPGSVIAGQHNQVPASLRPASHEQPAVEWPADNRNNKQEDQNKGQGTNPFGWTNSGPTVPQSLYPTANRQLSEFGRQPWQWTNEPAGGQKPREVLPPEEPSFNSAVLDALKWSDHPAAPGQQQAATDFPPANATEEELIAWEKEHLPWTRPFYWSNSDTELGPEYEIIAPDATPSRDNVPMIARPFTWENRQAAYQPRAAGPSGETTYPTTQAAAYFQAGESLPPPEAIATPLVGNPLDDPFADDPNGAGQAGIDEEKKGGLAEAESLGEAPVDNSLQFLRADTVLLDPGEFQYEYGFSYSKFDLSLPIVLTGLGGSVVELADFHIREFRVPLEIRYGLARRIQLFVNVPFGWSNTEFSFPGFEDFENDGGLGDIIFGSSFLLRDNDPCNKPDAILTLSSVAPTGNEPFTPAGLSPSSPSLGSGVWSLAANLLFIQNYDPVVVFYGFGTRQSFEGELDDRDFQPGGEYNYQFGVGFAVNRSITFSTRFNGAYVSDTKLDGDRLPGTTQEPMILSLAMTVSKNKKLIEPFVDFGLTDDSTDARFGITWTH